LTLAEHGAVVDDPQQLRRWLEAIDELGFGVLSGVPVESPTSRTRRSASARTRTTLSRPRTVAAAPALPVLKRERR
jgi:hypothetical protein